MTDSNDSERIIALEHIRLVGIGYVVAAVFGLFEFIETVISYCLHGVFGLATFTDYAVKNNLRPSALETISLIIFSFIPLVLALLQIIAYLQIRKRKSLNFCIVISILSIVSVPVGTIIGLAGLLALVRRPTRVHFDSSTA